MRIDPRLDLHPLRTTAGFRLELQLFIHRLQTQRFLQRTHVDIQVDLFRLIGFVLAWMLADFFGDPFHAGIVKGFELFFDRCRYHLQHWFADEKAEEQGDQKPFDRPPHMHAEFFEMFAERHPRIGKHVLRIVIVARHSLLPPGRKPSFLWKHLVIRGAYRPCCRKA